MGTMQFFLWRSNNERILENIENYLSISDDSFKWHFIGKKITSNLKWSSQLISLDNNGHQRIVHIRFELVQRNVEAQEQNYSCILLYLSYFWWAFDLNLSLQMHVITTFDRMIPFFAQKIPFSNIFFTKKEHSKIANNDREWMFSSFFSTKNQTIQSIEPERHCYARIVFLSEESSLMLSRAILSSTFIISGFIRVEIER